MGRKDIITAEAQSKTSLVTEDHTVEAFLIFICNLPAISYKMEIKF